MTTDRRAVATLPRPAVGAPPAPRLPRPERWALENGLRVVVIPRGDLPQIALKLILPAGSAADPDRFPGTASLVARLLTEGTARYDATELNTAWDALGASVHAHAGHDFVEVEAALLSETLDPVLGLLGETVIRPTFPAAEVERVRAETLDALEARLDEPANVADDRAAAEVFGLAHPYGLPAHGTPDGVASVSRDLLEQFHTLRYRPAAAVLIVAGDVDAALLRELLERHWGAWAGAAPPVAYPALPNRPEHAGQLAAIPWPDAPQSEIRIVGLGMRRTSPDWVPALVANYVLGGSTITGRLGANLREDKGWTYGVRSGFAAALQPGGWAAETAVDAEVTNAALREMLGEMQRLCNEPVPAEELQRAKDAVVLSLPRAFETPANVVGRYATLEAYQLPANYWEQLPEKVARVTTDDVLRIARRFFDPAQLVRVVAGASA